MTEPAPAPVIRQRCKKQRQARLPAKVQGYYVSPAAVTAQNPRSLVLLIGVPVEPDHAGPCQPCCLYVYGVELSYSHGTESGLSIP